MGIMDKEMNKEACAEIVGCMYGNVYDEILYCICFSECAVDPKGLVLNKIKVDSFIFYRSSDNGIHHS